MPFSDLGSGERNDSRGWLHSHSAVIVDLFRFVDFGWVICGLWLSVSATGSMWTNEQWLVAFIASGFFALFVTIWPLYRSWRLAPLRSELIRVSLIWMGSVSLVSLVGSFSAFSKPISTYIPIWTVTTLSGLVFTRVLLRIGLRTLRRKGGNFRKVAIAGANSIALSVAHEIRYTSWMGLKLIGVFDDRAPVGGRISTDISLLGTLDDLVFQASNGEFDIVYITLPLSAECRIKDLVLRLHDSTVSVHYVPDFSVFGLLNAKWDTLGRLPAVSLIDTPHKGVDALLKRVFDIIIAGSILLVLALPMLIIGLAIKQDSSGPAIFRQQRYGLDGKKIDVWKFRTMRVCEDGSSTFVQATQNDKRVTPLGRILRRLSIDELPQLIQVLKGDMSLVGPRPHPIALNEEQRKLIDGYMLRHKVKPGITGWAQVNGYRGETDTPEKMEGRIKYDLAYINNWSLGLDFRIIFLTIGRVMDDPNAY